MIVITHWSKRLRSSRWVTPTVFGRQRFRVESSNSLPFDTPAHRVGKAGFEPATSASRTLRANQAALLPGVVDGTRPRCDQDWLREVGVVVVGAAVEQGSCRTAEADGLERLEQPALHQGPASDEHVG